MHHISFDRIRGGQDGQRLAFEAFVCQVARREVPESGAEFHRIHGAGGDGGVEGYWLLKNGRKIGYQAKFFLHSRFVDWAQIDGSVHKALRIHPELSKYIIALPCNLTDKTGAKGKGKSGWEHWNNHKENWGDVAKSVTGHVVEFIPWTASEIEDKLIQPVMAGLRAYWFGNIEFTSAWFKRHIELSVAALDERYHPEDHVDLDFESIFAAITRSTSIKQRLAKELNEIQKHSFSKDRFGNIETTPGEEAIAELDDALKALIEISSEIENPQWMVWKRSQWKIKAERAVAIVNKLFHWTLDIENSQAQKTKTEDEQQKHHQWRIISIRNDLRALLDAIRFFDLSISHSQFDAESQRIAIVHGRAGSGKSHLLARAAEQAIAEERPVLLLLGQQFRDQPIWPQILDRIGLSSTTSDALLGALDSAAEHARTRALILVDAINEGPGAGLWRKEAIEFIERVRQYPNIAIILTCRSEYLPYVIPSSVLGSLPKLELRGFVTAEEQLQAARVYLDKRGITRPAAPWLAPEFTNPLFLRSACIAISHERKSEFPKGLTGTKKILSFFINSVARHLGAGRDGSDDLVGPVNATLLAVAKRMAEKREDFLSASETEEIAAKKFLPYTPPVGETWTDVLHRNGLFRFDPDPNINPDAPLTDVRNVIRFSFQRFQDHLFAEAILGNVVDPKAAFINAGPLTFILNRQSFHWKWLGLLGALSVQLPEKYGIELVDALPGEATQWWGRYEVIEAFAESVRWRDKSSFSDRTIALLNSLSRTHIDLHSLLIQIAVSIAHPWNAKFLHRNLVRRAMPDRDAFWTVPVSHAAGDEESPTDVLIDWCLYGQNTEVEKEAQSLAAITLAWCFTSTNRSIRDRSTKALTSLFLSRSNIFLDLMDHFREVDDPYVHERLWAAAYGACCLSSDSERISTYAECAAKNIFGGKGVPLDLLLRDYARGIIELANIRGMRPKGFDMIGCRPPYRTPLPNLNISKEELEEIAAKAGDKQIVYSCVEFGDFGRYEIEPAVRQFVPVMLSNPPPYTARENLEKFEKEVVANDCRRGELWKKLRQARIPPLQLLIDTGDTEPSVNQSALEKWQQVADETEKNFLGALTALEVTRYEQEALPWFASGSNGQLPIDIGAIQRWIAKRAYDLGWTKERFPNDGGQYGDYSRNRPRVERIGKKYQWIALGEMLCGLADNYWMGGLISDGTKPYDRPLDIGFIRDIDPTVIPIAKNRDIDSKEHPSWVFGPAIGMEQVSEADLVSWPYRKNPADNFANLIIREDEKGKEWVVLYDHRGETDRYKDRRSHEHGLRQQEFRFILCAVIPAKQRRGLVRHLSDKREIEINDWKPPEFVDGPFLFEAPWCATWGQDRWIVNGWGMSEGFSKAMPTYEYYWESHLDASLPKGASGFIPSPWLARDLGLSPERTNSSRYCNNNGETCFIGSKMDGDISALIDSHMFQSYLRKNSLECVWLIITERNVWPNGGNANAAWRRAGGICWREREKIKTQTWHRDQANGASQAVLKRIQSS